MRALSSTSVEITGQVEDVRPYLSRAKVAVVPLWSGGGTRLKVLEAFAAGRPVVSTTIGAEGIDARDGEHLLLADSPEAFAEAIVRVLVDDALAAGLGSAGRQLAEERYGWGNITRQLVATHDQALISKS
jgi:glycosyltransferase involved in cell wall biosynthesis